MHKLMPCRADANVLDADKTHLQPLSSTNLVPSAVMLSMQAIMALCPEAGQMFNGVHLRIEEDAKGWVQRFGGQEVT